jgi:hypothetical protein
MLETTVVLIMCACRLAGCSEGPRPPAGGADQEGARGDDGDAETSAAAEIEVIAASGPLRLAAGASRFDLEPTGDLAAALSALTPDRGLVLLVRDLHAESPPGVLYHLYLGLAEGEEPAAEDGRYCGAVNFFDTVPGKAGFYSFDVSSMADALRRQARTGGPLTVTVIPAGTPAANARAVIDRVELALR